MGAITLVVWTVMSIRSTRIQATLYGFPVPITIALLGGDRLDVAAQYAGVVVLVAFFFVVALLADRVDRASAVAGGVAAYVLLAVAVDRWLPLGPLTAFVAAGACWLAHLVLARRRQEQPASAQAGDAALVEEPGRPGPLVWLSVPVATALTWLLGGLLGSLVVTFPYSGVPVALTARGDRFAFAHHFARRAGLILGFLGLFHLCDGELATIPSLAVAWGAFLGATLVINRRGLLRRLRPAPPQSAPTART